MHLIGKHNHYVTPLQCTADAMRNLATTFPLLIVATKEQKKAKIKITGGIYDWQESLADFGAQVDQLIDAGIEDVEIYVNSPGGDVFVAAEIGNQIERFKGHKHGIGGALVASAATIIALSCDTFEMASNGQFMYHKPSGWISGNEDKVSAQLVLLQNLTSQYRTLYAQKTGLPEATIEANWAKGDVWLTAKQALEQGFVTAVREKEKIDKTTALMITACGGKPPKTTEFNFDTNMKNRNQIIALLKLSADATDEQIQAAIEANSKKASQVDRLLQQEAQNREKEINALVDQAIADKKITADVKATYVALATKDFESTKSIIEAMKPIEKPTLEPTGDNGSREKWTMEDWQAQDPEGLKKMMVEKPEAFQKLEAAYFGK